MVGFKATEDGHLEVPPGRRMETSLLVLRERQCLVILGLTKVPFGEYVLFFLGFWKANPRF